MLIKPNCIKTNVSASNWKEVIQMAGDLLINNGNIEQSYVDSMINTVLELGPYMILLPQLAFFHGKPGEGVNEVGISLIVLDEPVIFDDFENQEIKCAFAFSAVDSDSHLSTLQKFAELLSNEPLIELLVNNGNKEEILEMINGGDTE